MVLAVILLHGSRRVAPLSDALGAKPALRPFTGECQPTSSGRLRRPSAGLAMTRTPSTTTAMGASIAPTVPTTPAHLGSDAPGAAPRDALMLLATEQAAHERAARGGTSTALSYRTAPVALARHPAASSSGQTVTPSGAEGPRRRGCGMASRREGRAEVGRSGCPRRAATVRQSQAETLDSRTVAHSRGRSQQGETGMAFKRSGVRLSSAHFSSLVIPNT
jgi:hypothetical protein